MTKREWIDYCLTFADAYEDYPFDDEWAAMRHRKNRRAFAFIYCRHGELCLNLKCKPLDADFLRGMYTAVRPAYHMNKTHWNTVAADKDVPDEEICAMIAESHALTIG